MQAFETGTIPKGPSSALGIPGLLGCPLEITGSPVATGHGAPECYHHPPFLEALDPAEPDASMHLAFLSVIEVFITVAGTAGLLPASIFFLFLSNRILILFVREAS